MGTISFLEIFTLFYTIGKSIWNEIDTWTLVKKKNYQILLLKKAYRSSCTPDAGLWMLDSECWTVDAGLWTLNAGLWTLDTGLWMLDSGYWTQDAGLWILDATLRKLDSEH